MRRIIEDDQVDEPVRHFFEQFAPSAEANVMRVAGHEVYFVVRRGEQRSGRVEPWSAAKNKLRFRLIRKEIAGTISPEEVLELADLTRQMRAHVNRIAPRVTPELEKLHATVVGGATQRSTK